MQSKFAIAGHPIHPALVAVPIGLFVWALVADVIYVFSDENTMWYDIAFWSGIAAIVTALVAALPGFGDYFTMARDSDARDIATAHMVLNLTTVGLYAIAAVLMLDHNATDGTALGAVIALHAAGTGLLLLSGWLGGEMVFRHHLAMVPEDAEVESSEQQRHSLRRGTRAAPRPRG
jgi:uncharacterized membrane protein